MISKYQNLEKVRLIVVFGKPGAGKTYLSRILARKLNFKLLDSDEIRNALFPKASFDDKETVALWDIIYQNIRKLLESNNRIILNACINKFGYRETLVTQLLRGDWRSYVAIWVDCGDTLAMRRIKSRSVLENPYGCDIKTFEGIKEEISFSIREPVIFFCNKTNSHKYFKDAFDNLILQLETMIAKRA